VSIRTVFGDAAQGDQLVKREGCVVFSAASIMLFRTVFKVV
jgi:hypothetical protein